MHTTNVRTQNQSPFLFISITGSQVFFHLFSILRFYSSLSYKLFPHIYDELYITWLDRPLNAASAVYNIHSYFLKFNKVKWKSLSCVWLFATPWTILSMEFSRPEYWSGLPFPSPGDHPNPGIKPRYPALQADSLPAEPQGKPNFNKEHV